MANALVLRERIRHEEATLFARPEYGIKMGAKPRLSSFSIASPLMFLLARKNLLVQKGRFLLAITGISSAVILVLLLMGLYDGWREHMSAYLNHVHTDVWIGQKGAYDLFQTLSLLPAEGEDLLREADGVKKVSPFVGRLMTVEVRGQKRHSFIVGVADADSGPVELVSWVGCITRR